MPAGINVTVVEETADTLYLVLPHTVAEGDELSDSDLEAVAGGAAPKSAPPIAPTATAC